VHAAPIHLYLRMRYSSALNDPGVMKWGLSCARKASSMSSILATTPGDVASRLNVLDAWLNRLPRYVANRGSRRHSSSMPACGWSREAAQRLVRASALHPSSHARCLMIDIRGGEQGGGGMEAAAAHAAHPRSQCGGS
jgi:hypothetical protein